jgi:hypothetical protein
VGCSLEVQAATGIYDMKSDPDNPKDEMLQALFAWSVSEIRTVSFYSPEQVLVLLFEQIQNKLILGSI